MLLLRAETIEDMFLVFYDFFDIPVNNLRPDAGVSMIVGTGFTDPVPVSN